MKQFEHVLLGVWQEACLHIDIGQSTASIAARLTEHLPISLTLGLDKLPRDLPERLRSAKLSNPTASFLPGGASRYLDILASHVDCRIRLLHACRKPSGSPREAALVISDGTAAMVDWWKLHRYVGGGEGSEAFQWSWIHPTQYGLLKDWCKTNATDSEIISELAVSEIVKRGILVEKDATDRVRELMDRGK